MTKEMDPNLSPETIKELMGDDVREYRQKNNKTREGWYGRRQSGSGSRG